MEYWRGMMNWPLNKGWKCPTCGGNYGLEWGLVHAQCRCNECHTQFRMRDKDEKVVDIPICQLKPEYAEPAQIAWGEWKLPVDQLTEEQWDEAICKAKVKI